MSKIYPNKVTTRPSYIDLGNDPTIDLLTLNVEHTFDVVEPKYDGIWVRVEFVKDKRIDIWSRHGQCKSSVYSDIPSGLDGCVLHGEFMYGSNWSSRMGLSGKSIIFDCTMYDGLNISGYPLDFRRQAANIILSRLKGFDSERQFSIVEQRPVSAMEYWWKELVLDKNWEGLIIKSSKAPFGATWARMKRIYEVDYVCLGFNQSTATKYKGKMVSSIKAGLMMPNGKFEVVCNVSGLDERLRTKLYDFPNQYIGKVLKASGKGIFENGAVRHPNFVEWHNDKLAEHCTLESVQKLGGWIK